MLLHVKFKMWCYLTEAETLLAEPNKHESVEVDSGGRLSVWTGVREL